MPGALRKLIVAIHLWIGLVAGVLFLLVATTGLLMIFRTEIEHVVHPERHVVQAVGGMLPLDELAVRARAAHPGSAPELFRLEGRRDAPVIVKFKDKELIYLDPYTGRVQAQVGQYQGVFGRIEQLHRFFVFSPSVAEPLAGSLALLALLMLGSGFWLWLPRTWRLVRQTFLIRRGQRGHAPWLAWHKLVGVLVAVIVGFSAFTGVPQGLEWAKRLLFVDDPAPVMASALADDKTLPLQTLWDRAAFVVPDAAESCMYFPTKGVAEFYMIERKAPHPNARTYVWLDARTGGELRHAAYARAPWGFRLYYWMFSAHQGMIGGLAGQLALVGGSAGFIALVVTGMTSYFSRKSSRAARYRPAQVAAEPLSAFTAKQ